jgi:NhaP-type Na+/H+ or K+/H+ antiporter
LIAILFTSFYSETVINSFAKNQDRALLGVLFLTAVVFMLSSIVHHTSRLTKLPTFVLAIFVGMLAKPFLEPITTNHESLSALVGLGATLILFGGGLDTSFVNFKKLIAKILSISFLGLFITALFTSFAVYILNLYFSLGISIITAVLLGAVLASTDPAAIIPILGNLKFKNRSLKDIIVSESAVTDVTGTLLTIIFLTLVAKNVSFGSVVEWYGSIFTKESGIVLFNQIFWGALLGLIGYFFLQLLSNFKEKKEYGHEADLPFFLFIPIIIFVFALDFGGSGYLAAFIAGLMFHLKEHLKDIEGFFNSLVERIPKTGNIHSSRLVS